MPARSFMLSLLLVSLALTGRAGARPGYWHDLRLHRDTLQKTGFTLRPEYLMGFVDRCGQLAVVYAEDRANVSADDARIAREVCIFAARMYRRTCLEHDAAAARDRGPAAVCRPTDGPTLARGVAALGPLSADEQALYADIPARFWLALDEPRSKRSRNGAAIDLDVTTCLEAAAQLGATPPPAPFRRRAQDVCITAARLHDRSCVGQGIGAPGCTSGWQRWAQVRDAAIALGPLDAEAAGVLAHILDSAELADHHAQIAFDRIVQAHAEHQLDTCAMLAQLRAHLATPEEARAQTATATGGRSPPAVQRRSRFEREVRETYERARRTLAEDVEQITRERAELAATELACLPDLPEAAALVPAAQALVADVIAYQAAEAACLADPRCRATRQAEQICRALADRRAATRDIAREMHYARQAGVVDLRRLDANKQALEALDAEIATAKDAYRALAGRAFSGACKPPRGKWKKRMPATGAREPRTR